MHAPQQKQHGSFLSALLLLLLAVGPLCAQIAAPNRVLELDGKDSYVNLPAGIFDELTEATVEIWARWENMGQSSTLFDYGEDNTEMVIGQHGDGPNLRFQIIYRGAVVFSGFEVNDLLRLKEWCHIAAVSGRGGMALYFNGVLVGRNELPESFATIPKGKNHLLGRNTGMSRAPGGLPLFHGQLDEIRVWKVRRTPEQIRENMFKSLAGTEPGLAGLWNFESVENGVVKDATPAAHHGRLIGNARVVSASARSLDGASPIRTFAGTVRDAAGKLMTNAVVTVLSGMNKLTAGTTDGNGRFAVACRVPSAESVDLRVVSVSGDYCVWLLDQKPGAGEFEHNVTLTPGSMVRGRVRAFDNSGIRNVVVQLIDADAPDNLGAPASPPARTPTGNTPAGTPALPGSAPKPPASESGGNLGAPASSPARTPTGNTPAGTPALPGSAALSRDAATGEVENFSTPGLRGTVWTDASGQFEFTKVRPGKVKVRIHLPDRRLYHPETLTVIPGSALTAEFQIPPFRKGKWQHFTPANGLPSSQVFDLRFARDGMLWLATAGGLASFDGRDFTRLSRESGLLDNSVYSLAQAQDGTLWCGTAKGVSQIDPVRGRVIGSHRSGTNGLAAGRVFGVAQGPGGTLWIRTRDGLSRYASGRFEAVPGIDRLDQSGIGESKSSALVIEPAGVVWTVTEGLGLNRVEGTNVTRFGKPEGLQSGTHDSLHIAPDGALWMQDGWNSAVLVSRIKDGRITALPRREIGRGTVLAIHATRSGEILFGGFDGELIRFDLRRHTVTVLGGESDSPTRRIWKIAEGPDGALWCATSDGLYRYEEAAFSDFTPADGLLHAEANLIHRTTDGSIWFIRNQGNELARLDPEKISSTKSPFRRMTAADGLKHDRVFAVVADSQGGLWVGGVGGGAVDYYDPAAEQRGEPPFRSPPSMQVPQLRTFVQTGLRIDTKGRFWISQYTDGLWWLPFNQVEKPDPIVTRIEDLPNTAMDLYEDVTGAIWVFPKMFFAPVKGVSRIRFDAKGGHTVDYYTEETTAGGLPSDLVTCLQDGADGQLYLGTDNGLARLTGRPESSPEWKRRRIRPCP